MAVNLIMLGPPGAGKGTQAESFARENRIPRISTGDMLREAVQAGTPVGLAAKARMDDGALVSDDVMVALVGERLERPDTRPGFVLDGFPRTVAQAGALDALIAGRDPLVVVEMVVPGEVLVRRVLGRRICSRCGANAGPGDDACAKCGGPFVQRSDDSEQVVRARLDVYERETRPLVSYYRCRPTFRTVDGNRPPGDVAAAIREAVASALASEQSS